MSNLHEVKDRIAAISSRASLWYKALGDKGLLHDKLLKTVSAHVNVMGAWCAKSFEDLRGQIRDLNHRMTQQEAAVAENRSRIRLLYKAAESTNKGYLSCQSILDKLQLGVSAIGGLQGLFDGLALRFDTFQSSLAAFDNRIEELERHVKVIRYSLESVRARLDAGELGRGESMAGRSLGKESTVKAEVSRELKRLLDQEHLLDKKLDAQKRQLHDHINSLEKRIRTEQASLKNQEDTLRTRLDTMSVSSEVGQVLIEAKALVQEKYNAIANESKRNFEQHSARITALEQDVYKQEATLPVGERLDALEYDVQKMVESENDSAEKLRDAIENLDRLQNLTKDLRLATKNAVQKLRTSIADSKASDRLESAIQQLTTRLEALEHDSISHMDKVERVEEVQRECRQLLDKAQQLTESGEPRLNDLEMILKQATEIISIGLVQIKQQVECLEKDFEGVGHEIGKCVINYLEHTKSDNQSQLSVSPSTCSVEAVYESLHPPAMESHETPLSSGQEEQTESIDSPVLQSDAYHHRLVSEGYLAPSKYNTAIYPQNIAPEDVRQALDKLNNRCAMMEAVLEALGSMTDARMNASREAGMVGHGTTEEVDRAKLDRISLPELDIELSRTVTTGRRTEPSWLQEAAPLRSAATAFYGLVFQSLSFSRFLLARSRNQLEQSTGRGRSGKHHACDAGDAEDVDFIFRFYTKRTSYLTSTPYLDSVYQQLQPARPSGKPTDSRQRLWPSHILS
ncbi:hypothetical protein NCC49_006289 [Naganishia albida]|nr:hypothetical protein NCC49_006289 [Naganishia albida]